MGTGRVINLADGYTSSTAPTIILGGASIDTHANDAAFEADKGSAGAVGDFYFQTTDYVFRAHNGNEWYSTGIYNVDSATQSLAASGEITTAVRIPLQTHLLDSTGGAVVLSTTPLGSTAHQDGAKILLIGQSDTDTVEIQHNDAAAGFILNGNIVLGKNDTLEVMYDATQDRYIELSRNQ